jgi:hypothetical protein
VVILLVEYLYMKKFIFGLSLLLVLFCSAPVGYAADFRVADDGGNVTVSKEEKVKNLYVGGNVVTVKADIEKSLYVGGNTVTVEGDVENDVFVGGGTVIFKGDVGGSIHVGGGTVIVEGEVTDDLFAGGGNVLVAESASVGGDLFAGGGMVSIQGPVEGNVFLGAGEAVLNSKVGGKVKAEVESLELGEKAEIVGDVSYKSENEVGMSEKAVVLGEVKYEKAEYKKAEMIDSSNFKSILKKISYATSVGGFVVSLVAGLSLIYLFGKKVKVVVNKSLVDFGSSFGIGLVALIFLPLLAMVMLISLIGLWVGGLVMIVYSLMFSLATALASIALGAWLIKVFKGKGSKYLVNWKAVVVGTITIGLLGLVLSPLGGLVKFVFMMASLGALYRLTYGFVKDNR